MNKIHLKGSLIVLIVLFCCPGIYAQVGGPSNPYNYEKVKDVLPPAPNAAALGKYGGFDVSLNSGALNKTIPLYTFTYRKIVVPISLSYSTTGFKVDEIASRVGYGWTLNTGGVINRSILGAPDDVYSRIFPPSEILTNQESYDFLEAASQQGGVDTQPDMFSFNFNGYTGRFVFDENMNPVQLPAGNLKIEKDFSAGAAWQFRITTPDGNKYYFGGASATEKTRKETSCGKPNEAYQATAWYLTKIENPDGAHVDFEYEALNFLFESGITETLIHNNPSNAGLHCTGPALPGPDCEHLNNSSCYNILRSQGVFLKEITTIDGGKVILNFTNRFDYADKLISGFTVKDFNNVDKFKIGFEYQHVTSTAFSTSYSDNFKRPFLTKLIEYSLDDTPVKEHKFSYKDIDQLPVQLTRAQDHWGYFNGKNNSSLVAKPYDYNLQLQFPDAIADREPYVDFAKKGILSKIEYPTGGWENIYYEGNVYRGSKVIHPSPALIQTTITGEGFKTLVTKQSSQFTISEGQYVKLGYTVSENPGGVVDPLHNKGSIVVYKTGSIEIFRQTAYPPDNVSNVKAIWLSPGTYWIHVEASGDVVTTYAYIFYTPGTSTQQEGNYACGGVRVSKIESYDGVKTVPEIKRYCYSKLTTPTISSGAYQPEPHYFKQFYIRKGCSSGMGGAYTYDQCDYNALYSYSLTNLNIYPQGSSYETVIEGFGDNFQNGAIEHTYRTAADVSGAVLNSIGNFLHGSPVSNTSRDNGKELTQVLYKNTEGSLLPVKKIINTYKNDSRRFKLVVGNAVNKAQIILNYGPAVYYEMIQAFDAVTYNLVSNWEYVEKTEELTYDENGLNPVTTVTNYFYYDNDQHLQLTRSDMIDSKGQLLSTVQKYPGDFVSLTAIDALTQGVKNLQTQNITAPVIEKTIYRKNSDGTNSRLLASTLIAFRSDNMEPSYISQTEAAGAITDFAPAQASGGAIIIDSRYKQQISFDEYDANGNILQQSNTNNIKLTYIWDYNKTYPIASVQNAIQSDVAYTSFEANGSGNWNTYTGTITTVGTAPFPPTGKKFYNLTTSATLSKSVLIGDIYIVSYWSNNSSPYNITGGTSTVKSGKTINGWTYHEHTVTASATSLYITGTGGIDELRLYPENALMVTAIYEPLIGITSQCDANNRITYYEYDGFNRLSLIRDQDKNILKRISYKYTEQETLPQNTTITSTNYSEISGFTAVYTNISTGQQYSFAIPTAAGLQTLGSLPTGLYNLTISKPGNNLAYGFSSGCGQWIWSTSATFSNIDVSNCNSIAMDLP